ncbi:MAG: hypothetical protein AAF692_12110 [Pseudomonadota bacterium]
MKTLVVALAVVGFAGVGVASAEQNTGQRSLQIKETKTQRILPGNNRQLTTNFDDQRKPATRRQR